MVQQRLCWRKFLDLCKQRPAVFLQMYSPLPHHNLAKNLLGFWNRQTFTVRHWTNRGWYILVLHCPLFLLGNPFLNRVQHTEVAVCEVICQPPPYHGHCKQHGKSFAINPSLELWWTGCAAHVCSPALVLVTYFTSKVKDVSLFYHWG